MILKQESRLNFSELRSYGGISWWTRTKLKVIPPSRFDTWYVVKDGDRIDSIAEKKMGNEDYWWLIAYANDLFLLPTGLKTGMKLRIPNPKSVRDTFEKKI